MVTSVLETISEIFPFYILKSVNNNLKSILKSDCEGESKKQRYKNIRKMYFLYNSFQNLVQYIIKYIGLYTHNVLLFSFSHTNIALASK